MDAEWRAEKGWWTQNTKFQRLNPDVKGKFYVNARGLTPFKLTAAKKEISTCLEN
jgi:hypothetical protein